MDPPETPIEKERTWIVQRLHAASVGEIVVLALLVTVIIIISNSKFYVCILIPHILILLGCHIYYVFLRVHSTVPRHLQNSLADVDKYVWRFACVRIWLTVPLLLGWLRAMQVACDVNGGYCIMGRSLANSNSCTGGQFLYSGGPWGGCSYTGDAISAQTYHPLGVFPLSPGEYYSEASHNWAFCYLNQTFAYSKSTSANLIKNFPLGGNHYVNCDAPTPTGSISLNGCNGVACLKGYPSPSWGLKIDTTLSTANLSVYSSNTTTTGQLCPGMSPKATEVDSQGRLVTHLPNGDPVHYPWETYTTIGFTPKPICPLCLRYWQNYVAGTPGNPYKDNSMKEILEQCVDSSASSNAMVEGNYAEVNQILCGLCPGRNSWQSNCQNDCPPGFWANENYGMGETVAIVWLWTTYTWFVPIIWLVSVQFIKSQREDWYYSKREEELHRFHQKISYQKVHD
jgi:hypothetical protein